MFVFSASCCLMAKDRYWSRYNGDVKLSALLKRTRDLDMHKRVLGVLAVAAGMLPVTIFWNQILKDHLASLDPLHRPLHSLEVNRIIEVAIDRCFLEFAKICEDRRNAVHHGFMSLTTEFVTDSTRKKSFGVIVLDLTADCYEFVDGRRLFMSKESAKWVTNKLIDVSDVMCSHFPFWIIYEPWHINSDF